MKKILKIATAVLMIAGTAIATPLLQVDGPNKTVNVAGQITSTNITAMVSGSAAVSNHVDTLQGQYLTTSNYVDGLSTTQGLVVADLGSVSNHLDTLQGQYLTTSNYVGGLSTTQALVVSDLGSISNHLDTLQGQYLTTSNYVGGLSTTQGLVVVDLSSVSNHIDTLQGQYLTTSNNVVGLSTTQGLVVANVNSISNHLDTLQGQYLVTSNYVGGLSTTQGLVVADVGSISNHLDTLQGQYLTTSNYVGGLSTTQGLLVADLSSVSGTVDNVILGAASVSNHLDTLQGQYLTTSNYVGGLSTTQGLVVADLGSVSNHLDTLQGQYLTTSNHVSGLSTTQGLVIANQASISNHLDTLQGQYLVTSNYVAGLSTTQGLVVSALASVSNQVNGGIISCATATVSRLLNVTGFLTGSNFAQADYYDDNVAQTPLYSSFPYNTNDFKLTLPSSQNNGVISQISVSKGRQCTVFEQGSRSIWYSADGGFNWRKLSDMITLIGGLPIVIGIDQLDNNTFLFGGGGSSTNIYMTTDQFRTITTNFITPSGAITCIKHGDNGVVMANTDSGYVCISSNAGLSWTTSSVTVANIGSVYRLAYSGNNQWVAAAKGGYWYSADNGNTWTKAVTGSSCPYGVDAGVNGTVIACDGSSIWRSSTYGTNYSKVKSLSGSSCGYSVCYAGNGRWFANPWDVTDHVGITVYQSIDDGLTWTYFDIIPPTGSQTAHLNTWDMKMCGDNLLIGTGGTNGGVFVKGAANFNDASAGESGLLWLKPQAVGPTATAGGMYRSSVDGKYYVSTNGTTWVALETGIL